MAEMGLWADSAMSTTGGGLAFEPEDEHPPGWRVLDPDGQVVAAGPQTVLDASAGAGEET